MGRRHEPLRPSLFFTFFIGWRVRPKTEALMLLATLLLKRLSSLSAGPRP